ncbi:MAG: Uma2 family endonuclease [Chloroflexi bacterium]|nr:Uma2 family endonuclease [Chloroflexota bacterium]
MASILAGRRTELIDGEIIEMAPIGTAYLLVVTHLAVQLQALHAQMRLLLQQPLIVDEFDEPQPDLIVLRESLGHRKPRVEDCFWSLRFPIRRTPPTSPSSCRLTWRPAPRLSGSSTSRITPILSSRTGHQACASQALPEIPSVWPVSTSHSLPSLTDRARSRARRISGVFPHRRVL